MQAFVENLLLHIDDLSPLLVYGFFFLSGFLQIVFPPYPGDSVLVFGGCLGGAGGTAWAALLGYLTATIATSLALFELGYRLNRRIYLTTAGKLFLADFFRALYRAHHAAGKARRGGKQV